MLQPNASRAMCAGCAAPGTRLHPQALMVPTQPSEATGRGGFPWSSRGSSTSTLPLPPPPPLPPLKPLLSGMRLRAGPPLCLVLLCREHTCSTGSTVHSLLRATHFRLSLFPVCRSLERPRLRHRRERTHQAPLLSITPHDETDGDSPASAQLGQQQEAH